MLVVMQLFRVSVVTIQHVTHSVCILLFFPVITLYFVATNVSHYILRV